jgi:hypothetical protein
VPDAENEEPIRPRDEIIDYKVFENSDQKERRRSPLRTKSFDSKILFHQGKLKFIDTIPIHVSVNRPRLLENATKNGDVVELTNMRQHSDHISKESSTLESSR